MPRPNYIPTNLLFNYMELHRRIRPPLVEKFSAGKTFEDSKQRLLKCGQSGECLCVWLSISWLLLVCLVEGLPNFSCGPDGLKFRKKIMFGPTKLRKALLCLASDLTHHTESGKWWPKLPTSLTVHFGFNFHSSPIISLTHMRRCHSQLYLMEVNLHGC